MKSVKKILKYVAYTFLSFLILLCVYTFVVTDILKKDHVNIFGYTYFVVASGSMSGTIEVNDIIFVRLTKNVKVDDIISYKSDSGEIITHRVIDKSGNRLITKGDANNAQDDPISKNAVLGKIIWILSPKVILEFIAVCLIVFIGLALINFDRIFKRYVVKSGSTETSDFDREVLPQEVFSSPKDRKDYKHSGLTVTIPLKEIDNIRKIQDEEKQEDDDGVEILTEEEVLDLDSNSIVTISNTQKQKEKELVDLVTNLLRVKNDELATSRINKKWLVKYQFLYKISNIILLGDTRSLFEAVEHPTFKEVYDYDLEKIGLYENLRNKIYEMPIYVFLKILFIAILYNDDAFFDGVFKIMKYKIMIDKNNHFRTIDNSYSRKQLKTLINFMEKISKQYDNKNVFELDKIERMTKIKNYVND